MGRHAPIAVLVADSSEVYSELASNILSPPDFRSTQVHSRAEAEKILQTTPFDAIMIDTDLEGDGFALLEHVQSSLPELRAIMTTERSTDDYLDIALKEQIGNFLCKPLKRDELTGLVHRLVTGEGVFGLANYLEDIVEEHTLKIRRSADIPPAISMILSESEKWGFHPPASENPKLVLQEMIVNAVYHGNGFTREKLERKPVELPEGKFVTVAFGHDSSRFAVSITDYNGKLTKNDILSTLWDIGNRDRQIQELIEKGEDPTPLLKDHGRGLELCRKLSVE